MKLARDLGAVAIRVADETVVALEPRMLGSRPGALDDAIRKPKLALSQDPARCALKVTFV